jgi:hypothetical protein
MTNGNDSVNPIIGSIGDEDHGGKGVFMNCDGLTKREYFAVMAMQAVVTNSDYGESVSADADIAVKYADALIDALNKEAANAN